MYGHDVEGGIRAKVLGELMHHMISMHGKSTSAALPDPSGGSKHDPAKVSMHGGVSDKTSHLSLGENPVDMNEHGGEGDKIEDQHELGDLFGRKKKSGMTEF